MSEDEMATMMAPQAPYRQAMPPSRGPARAAQRKKRKGSAAIVVVLTMLGLLAVGALSIGLYLANQTQQVDVPNLAGKTQADAGTALANAGLRGDPHSTTGPNCTGLVVDQNPKFGNKANKGDQVDYTVCTGPNQVQVPTLAKFTVADAEQRLKEAGLLSKTQQVDSPEPQGTVVGTQPDAGTTLKQGDTVTLLVSKGNQAIMPELSGLTIDEAKKALKDAGFTVTNSSVRQDPSRVVSDPTQIGKIIGQKPQANQPYAKNVTVTVTLGKSGDTSPSPSTSGSASPPPN
jgi:serine/threonine-protein kinase